MDLKEYTKQALSAKQELGGQTFVNGQLLINALALSISAGQLLNQVRAKMEGDLYDQHAINEAHDQAIQALKEINGTNLNSGENDHYKVDPQILHSMLSIASLNAEMNEALCNVMLHDYDFDINYNLLNEIGDIAEQQTRLINALGGDWEQVLKSSIIRIKNKEDAWI